MTLVRRALPRRARAATARRVRSLPAAAQAVAQAQVLEEVRAREASALAGRALVRLVEVGLQPQVPRAKAEHPSPIPDPRIRTSSSSRREPT